MTGARVLEFGCPSEYDSLV